MGFFVSRGQLLKKVPISRWLLASLMLSVGAFAATETLRGVLLPYRTFTVSGYMPDVAVSPDGKYLAVIHDADSARGIYANRMTLTVYKVNTRSVVQDEYLPKECSQEKMRSSGESLRFARDSGSVIICGTKIGLPNGIHDVETIPEYFPAKNERVQEVSYDGRFVLYSVLNKDQTSRSNHLLDVVSGRKYAFPKADNAAMNWWDADFSRDGKTLHTVDRDVGRGVWWSTATGGRIPPPVTIPKRDYELACLDFSNDETQIVTAWRDKTVLVSPVSPDALVQKTQSFFYDGDFAHGAYFADNDRFVVVSGLVHHSLPDSQRHFNQVWHDPHDPPTTYEPLMSIWNLQTGKETRWRGDGRIMRGGYLFRTFDYTTRKNVNILQDLRTGETRKLITLSRDDVSFYTHNSIGRYLVGTDVSQTSNGRQITKVFLWETPKR